ncbi:MAG: hypothetical protein ACI9VR_001749 [Cognaticolwellia sp.]|jgi:hypothetical protein
MLLLLLACNSSFYDRIVVEGTQANQSLGKQPAYAGDVDGDGVGDLAVRDSQGTLVFSGAVILGDDSPTVESAWTRLPLPANLDFPDTTQQLGEIQTIGDLNGDGLDELVDAIACRNPDSCGTGGWIRVYDGASIASGTPSAIWTEEVESPDVLAIDTGIVDAAALPVLAITTGETAWVVRGEDLRDGVPFSGTEISGPHADLTLADLNADGLDELVIGQPDAPGGGRVRVYTWTGTERRPDPLESIIGPDDARFGVRIASVDLDHGGQEDLLISGSPFGDEGDAPGMMWHISGEALALEGGRIELESTNDASFNTLNQADLQGNIGLFGHSLDACEDLDGDGLNDLVFAARPNRATLVGTRDGRILGLSSQDSSASFLIWQHSPRAGWLLYVACLGDLDGDGLGEILVGAPGTLQVDEEGAGEFWILSTGTQ